MLPTIDKGASIAVSVTAVENAGGVVDIHNKSFGSGVSKGTTAGGVAGGLWGFSCGPFWFVCVPAGVAMGMVPGAAAGAVVGASGALTAEKATQLRARLSQWQQSHDLRAQLHTQVAERAGAHWPLSSDAARFTVSVVLQDIGLTSTRDEQIGLVAHVRVSVSEARATAAPTEKVYEYVGPTSSLLVWLDERNDFIDTSFTSFSQQIAAQIVAELARR